MTLIRKMAGAGTLFAIAALVMGVFMAQTASAQPANPMAVYGITGQGDVAADDVIEVFVGGTSVGTANAVAGEGWILEIQNGTDGSAVTFTINGVAAAETVNYAGFQSVEVTLTEAAAPAPTPAPTGNAGLMGTTGTSMALILALGAFAAAMVAGARTATRTR
ncbi:MAG: hypothetical protein O2798_09245 [Chloroflexi bacterium]|nr:hypothetical protein [Chloroflexota bacterium]MDA1241011.1 hypothetical protein [Chloroflexota bacterium]